MLSVDLALSDVDVDAVRGLCREFVTWQLEVFPEKEAVIRDYFAPEKYEPVLADLPRVHARPGGGILLAKTEGRPVGCIMWWPAEEGVAEVKRLFVSGSARGLGAGRALVGQMVEQARIDGYSAMRLETARFLTSAHRLYAGMGFEPGDHGAADPPEKQAVQYYLRRAL